MSDNDLRPKWWLLDLIFLGIAGLLVLDGAAHLSEREHSAAEMTIILLMCVLFGLWLRANAQALRNQPRDRR